MMGGRQAGPSGMRGPGSLPGTATGMLDAIARLDLDEEQRARLEGIRRELNRRQQELMKRIARTSEKLHELYHAQMKASQTIKDLNAHVRQANTDAANRAEELLSDEQREALVNAGSHSTMPQQRP